MNPISFRGTGASTGFLAPLSRLFSRLQGPAAGPGLGRATWVHVNAPSRSPGACEPAPLEPRCTIGLTKAEAEELLDWLEANGYQDVEVSCEDGHYTVRHPGAKTA